MEQLAQEFIADLRREIMPFHDRPRELVTHGTLVLRTEYTMGIELLGEFYHAYQNGDYAQLTIFYFDFEPVVVSRVVFPDNEEGYWFRYQLNEENPGLMGVMPRPAATVDVFRDEAHNTVNLLLYSGGAQVAEFIFPDHRQ